MKSDVLEGKIQSNSRQATLLASYSMQAELGNYDPTRHTPECLQQCAFFAKDVIESEAGGKESLLNSAICQYKSLAGVTQAVAEELYISIAVQLEGYGHESFTAKVYIIIIFLLIHVFGILIKSINYFRMMVILKFFLVYQ